MTHPSPQTVTAQRVLSIDVLRGLTIALMILVNDPGDWSHTYTQLDHAPWNGFTLTDFVFPNFLFIVGASIIFSLHSRIARGESRKTLALHILRRAAIIFAIDVILSPFPSFDYTHLRFYGVLTRIALCYLAAGLICLITQSARGTMEQARGKMKQTGTLFTITASLLIGYWILMRFVPIPGIGTPTHGFPILDPECNLAAWFDRAVVAFTQRWLRTGVLYEHTRDPEGLLSTLPAIATTLIGAITSLWVRSASPTKNELSSRPKAAHFAAAAEKPPYFANAATKISPFNSLILAGILSLAAGLLWNLTFPINKNLWTSSYVLFSAGLSLLTLALCYWLIDIKRIHETRAGKWLTFPWLVFGSNAITAFILSNAIVEIMLSIKVPDSLAIPFPGEPTRPVTAWFWVYHHLFSRHGSTNVTSLAFALSFVALCFIPNYLLWRKQIFLKI
jgi:predicted acyltransferase